MLQVTCECGKNFRLRDADAGKRGRCSCGRVLRIPGTASSETASPAQLHEETYSPGFELVESLQAHKRLGQFVVLRKLGEGAMGEVWLAKDDRLGRQVAIKVLPSELRRDSGRLQRFEREARLMAQLHHAHTVTLLQFGDDDNLLYLVMEYVDGGSLADKVAKSGPLPWHEATQAIRDAAAGLAAAHKLSLIHRDIKPANLLRTSEGIVKIADFGLARAVYQQTELTQQGSVLGTPSYMSPEQWAGQPADVRSDLYALICSYYFLLTGKPPFEAENWMALGFQHRSQAFPDPRASVADTTIPEGVWRILQRGSQKNPERRYQTAAELLSDLEQLPLDQSQPIQLRSPRRVVTGNAVVSQLQLTSRPLRKVGLTVIALVSMSMFGLLLLVSVLFWNPGQEEDLGGKEQSPQGHLIEGAATELGNSKQSLPGPPADVAATGVGNSEPRPPTQPVDQSPSKLAVSDKPLRSTSTGMEFVLIPTGTFLMGSPESELNHQGDEVQHQVRIATPIQLGKDEVTQSQFEKVMSFNPSQFTDGDRSKLPVENVSWFDAVMFCNRMSEMDGTTPVYDIRDVQLNSPSIKSATVTIAKGSGYRLPTEAEWEYACRAGTTTAFSFGTNITTYQANYNGDYPYGGAAKGIYRGKTAAVDLFPANSWGLRNMHGNVWEWCWDVYGDYTSGGVNEMPNQSNSQSRVLRGGSFFNDASNLRSANRDNFRPDFRLNDNGFRVARTYP